jgi:hypothetical protein
MNDLKLLYSNEAQLLDVCPEFITFDLNMNRIYTTDNNKIFEIDSNDLKVI